MRYRGKHYKWLSDFDRKPANSLLDQAIDGEKSVFVDTREWRLYYRNRALKHSGALHELTIRDLEFLRKYGEAEIHTVVFRTAKLDKQLISMEPHLVTPSDLLVLVEDELAVESLDQKQHVSLDARRENSLAKLLWLALDMWRASDPERFGESWETLNKSALRKLLLEECKERNANSRGLGQTNFYDLIKYLTDIVDLS